MAVGLSDEQVTVLQEVYLEITSGHLEDGEAAARLASLGLSLDDLEEAMPAGIYQGLIDGVPAGQPFAAADGTAALKELTHRYQGLYCEGKCLTAHGEVITVHAFDG